MLYHVLMPRYQAQPSVNLQFNGACFEFGSVVALVDEHERRRRAHHKCGARP